MRRQDSHALSKDGILSVTMMSSSRKPQEMSVEAEYAYGWNRYIMMFMGIWPEHKSLTSSQASSYKALIPILMMFCFCCGPQSADLPFIWSDFDLLIENLSMANITITISLLKTIIFWLNGASLRTLVLYMTKDWSTTVNKRDRKTLLDIANITRKLSIGSTVLVLTVAMFYFMFRLSAIRQTGRQLFFHAYFPYNATSSPCYELTLFGQFAGAMYAATTYTVVDTFIATLVLHICGQLSNLRYELTNLYAYTKAEFQTKLGNIVRKHIYINRTLVSIVTFSIRFAEMIEDSFNMMLLLQMLGCSMQLCVQCLQAFMATKGKIDQVFIFKLAFLSTYVIYILLQLYLYCYIGEKLLIESTKMGYAAYNYSWYNMSAREARLLILIMCRARSPLQITAGRFCSFNRQLYSEVLKRSVAYMSCIYAMNTFE